MIAWFRANPRPILLIGIGIVILGGFFAVVAPLFDTGGAPAAQIAGVLPDHVTAGSQFEVDIALDNQGDSVLSQSCVQIGIQGPVRPDYAIFANIDRETFSNGLTCGGALSGQETISIRLFLTAGSPGSARVSLTPVQQSKTLGSGIAGTVSVGPA
ncbi:MAG: hypothetical protein JOY68_09295 [Candidatus Dormibacteraeota bacterium]|nr:hypothetical protein [Candidatus Dormibacteraeota bacterium]MBV8445745.1 hypothetical protein [Candidatus Dormibacteraeota bacterium]